MKHERSFWSMGNIKWGVVWVDFTVGTLVPSLSRRQKKHKGQPKGIRKRNVSLGPLSSFQKWTAATYHIFYGLALQILHTAVLPNLWFLFLPFRLPVVNCGLKIINRKCQKSFLNLKLHTIPSSKMRSPSSHSVLSRVHLLFVQVINAVCTTPQSQLSDPWLLDHGACAVGSVWIVV